MQCNGCLLIAALENTTLVTRNAGQLLCSVGTVFCAGQSSCDRKRGNRIHTKGSKSGTESGYPFIGFQLVYCMLGTTTAASSSSIMITLETEAFFLGLGLTVTGQKKV